MNKQDFLLQLSIVSTMLEGVKNDECMRPDLGVIASKLRLLLRSIPRVIEVPREATEFLGEVRRLKNRWNELYFGDLNRDEEPQPAVVSSRRRGATLSQWDNQEVAEFLELLSDDLAMTLFCVFGRVHPKAQVDGRWCAIGGGLGQEIVCDASALCEEYQVATVEKAWILAEDAMLLAAETGIHTAELSWIAESAAPSIHRLLTDGDPDVVMWTVVGRLLENGLLHTGAPADRPSQQPVVCVFHLTAAGVRRAQEARTRWTNTCSRQRPKPQDIAPVDDVPF